VNLSTSRAARLASTFSSFILSVCPSSLSTGIPRVV
jgi:hypothetical protein